MQNWIIYLITVDQIKIFGQFVFLFLNEVLKFNYEPTSSKRGHNAQQSASRTYNLEKSFFGLKNGKAGILFIFPPDQGGCALHLYAAQ